MEATNIKGRKGFRTIVVEGKPYQYCVSFPTDKAAVLIVYDGSTKLEIPLTNVPERVGVAPTWRGKHGDKSVGKYEVSYLIKNHK